MHLPFPERKDDGPRQGPTETIKVRGTSVSLRKKTQRPHQEHRQGWTLHGFHHQRAIVFIVSKKEPMV